MSLDAGIRLGIIGPGKAAELHASALAKAGNAKLVGVAGRNLDRARAFAERHRVVAFASVDAMLCSGEVDAVVVCTPHPTHARYSVLACEASVHVLVEKPMALTVADCDAMLTAAKLSDVRIGVVCQRRWYEPVRRMKDAIDAGLIGKPGLATVEVLGWRGPDYYALDPWRGTLTGEGGGVMVNQAMHQIDLFCWFMCSPVSSVTCYQANLNHPDLVVEDTAVAIVRFTSGAVGSIIASNSQKPGLHAKVHVHGRNGRSVGVETDRGSMFVAGVTNEIHPPSNDIWTASGRDMLRTWQQEDASTWSQIDPLTDYHARVHDDFAEAVLTHQEPSVTGRDGRQAVALLEAAYQSSRTHREVQLQPTPEGWRAEVPS